MGDAADALVVPGEVSGCFMDKQALLTFDSWIRGGRGQKDPNRGLLEVSLLWHLDNHVQEKQFVNRKQRARRRRFVEFLLLPQYVTDIKAIRHTGYLLNTGHSVILFNTATTFRHRCTYSMKC